MHTNAHTHAGTDITGQRGLAVGSLSLAVLSQRGGKLLSCCCRSSDHRLGSEVADMHGGGGVDVKSCGSVGFNRCGAVQKIHDTKQALRNTAMV